MSNPTDSTGHSTFDELQSQLAEYLKGMGANHGRIEKDESLKCAPEATKSDVSEATKSDVPDTSKIEDTAGEWGAVDRWVQRMTLALSDVPDEEQLEALKKIAEFLENDDHRILIVQGAAGTGKTSLMKGLVDGLKKAGRKAILLAPTGRAAKVLARRAARVAATIHSHIYKLDEVKDAKGNIKELRFELKEYDHMQPSLFVVDEASMLGRQPQSDGAFRSDGVLSDLIRHVFEAPVNNKLILVGDPYQLPPVGEARAVALNAETYKPFQLGSTEVGLKVVKRQSAYSAILQLASAYRSAMEFTDGSGPIWPETFDRPGADSGITELPDTRTAAVLFAEAYRRDPQGVIFLCVSNGWANALNRRIRSLLYPDAGALPLVDEWLMVVRNHYLKAQEFVANGEMLQVKHIVALEDQVAGFRWADVRGVYQDLSGEDRNVSATLLLDLLNSKSAGLDTVSWQKLWAARHGGKGYNMRDPYLNALHAKYAYAVTGHKAQGGEWPTVFVLMEGPYGTRDAHLRWLYTAVTRAREQLFLVPPR
ncbi:MAG: NACHT domain-containing protein [Bacteroidetes bacterium]|nr:NACHT domain-containing protein [Bacteroidota bacterium]